MKIKEAIIKARKKKKEISAPSIGYHSQTAKNLIYWLFVSAKDDKKSLQEFKKMLNATDWELD